MKMAAVVLASIAVARCWSGPAIVTIPEIPRDVALQMFEGWQAAFAALELDRLENGQMGNGQTQCPDGGHFAWSYLFDDATNTFQAVATPQGCSFTYEDEPYTVSASRGSSGVEYTYNPLVDEDNSIFPRIELRGDLDWSAFPDFGGQCHISITFVPWETTGTVCGFSVNMSDVAFLEDVAGAGHRVVGQIPSDREPEVPCEATAGVPFEIEAWTEGGGCVRTADTAEVSVDGSTAVVTPYDVYSFAGICPVDLLLFTHRADIVFDSPGNAHVVVRSSTSGDRNRDPDVFKVYTVEVLAATTGPPDG